MRNNNGTFAEGSTHLVTHGKSKTKVYGVWASMRSRCENPSNEAYDNYGGRGITVCDDWRSFSNFYRDMGDRPKGRTLERKDNNLGYSKENCIWADRKTQSLNKRNNVLITIGDETKPLSVWADQYGLPYKTVHQRISKYGWSEEDAIKTPVINNRKGISTNQPIHQAPSACLVRTEKGLEPYWVVAERFGVNHSTVHRRLNRGWTLVDAITCPPRRGRRVQIDHGVRFEDDKEAA